MNQKEIICGLLVLVFLYLVFVNPNVETFNGGGEMPLGQLMRKFVEHGSTPVFYR